MKIPNYDKKETNNNFKQLYDYMPDRCFRMLICGKSGCGKTNTVLHMLIKPLIYYDKIYLYSNILEQEKYTHLSKTLEMIAEENKILIDEIFHSLNEEIIPISEMEDTIQKMEIFVDYICEKNQEDIINYFIQGRHKNCCVTYLSQSYHKAPKDIRINCSNYIIFESPTNRENEAIYNDLGLDKEAYKRSFKNEYDFLYIDKPREIAKRNFHEGLQYMGLFNNIIVRKTDGSSTIVDYDIILSEYARKKDLANYLHKGRNKTNILHSDIDMGNNKITNLGNPGSANDAVSKRFLYKRIQKLTNDYSRESVSGKIDSINTEIAELQMCLLSNRKSNQEESMSLQNEIAKICEALSLNGVLLKMK